MGNETEEESSCSGKAPWRAAIASFRGLLELQARVRLDCIFHWSLASSR